MRSAAIEAAVAAAIETMPTELPSEALKTMPVYLMVDTSASMACASTRMSKQQLATAVRGQVLAEGRWSGIFGGAGS